MTKMTTENLHVPTTRQFRHGKLDSNYPQVLTILDFTLIVAATVALTFYSGYRLAQYRLKSNDDDIENSDNADLEAGNKTKNVDNKQKNAKCVPAIKRCPCVGGSKSNTESDIDKEHSVSTDKITIRSSIENASVYGSVKSSTDEEEKVKKWSMTAEPAKSRIITPNLQDSTSSPIEPASSCSQVKESQIFTDHANDSATSSFYKSMSIRTMSILSHGPRPEYSKTSSGLERKASFESRATVKSTTVSGSNFYLMNRAQTKPETGTRNGFDIDRKTYSAPELKISERISSFNSARDKFRFAKSPITEETSFDAEFFSTSSSINGILSDFSADPDTPPPMDLGESQAESGFNFFESPKTMRKNKFSEDAKVQDTLENTSTFEDWVFEASSNETKFEYPSANEMRPLLKEHDLELHRPFRQHRADKQLRKMYEVKENADCEFVIKSSTVFSAFAGSRPLKENCDKEKEEEGSSKDTKKENDENSTRIKFSAQVIGDTLVKGDTVAQKGLVFVKRKTENRSDEELCPGVTSPVRSKLFF